MSGDATFTADAIRQVEHALGVVLPPQYRDALLAYPFERDSDTYNWDLFGEAERIVEENRACRDGGFFGQSWPAQYLIIGGDGTGNVYYLDTARPNSPVFEADHGSTASSGEIEAEEVAPDLAAWVAHLEREGAEAEAEEAEKQERDRQTAEAKRNKKWWQFWI